MAVTTKSKLVSVIVQQSEDIFFVLFDQEITSLCIDPDICQIAALSLSNITKVCTCFILPRENVDPQASEVNHFRVDEMEDGECILTKNGEKVDAIPYEEGLKQFYSHLSKEFSSEKKSKNTSYSSYCICFSC